MSKIFATNKDINVSRLRCLLGWLAIMLPWIQALLYGSFPVSISETYYDARCIVTFMIILGSAALLLISYTGYDKVDDIVNTAAGIFGLTICFFPCWGLACEKYDIVGTFQIPVYISNTVHTIAAIIFFIILSINSLFLFTKSGPVKTEKKKKRNVIFIVCGIGMVASFLLMLLPLPNIRTWLTETCALFFFGLSFLTKSNVYKFLFAEDK